MKPITSCFMVGLLLTLFGLCKTHADIVLTVDWSNLSAVKFTATSGQSATTNTDWTYDEGFALLNFFTNNVTGQNFGTLVSSTLSDNVHTSAFFDSISSWNDSDGGHWPGNQGADLTLWSETNYTDSDMSYTTGTTAFLGEAIWDFSSNSSLTAYFPSLGSSGDLVVWEGHGTIGTWKVVGAAAVPEPSTYALIMGAAFLGLVVLRRHRRFSLAGS